MSNHSRRNEAHGASQRALAAESRARDGGALAGGLGGCRGQAPGAHVLEADRGDHAAGAVREDALVPLVARRAGGGAVLGGGPHAPLAPPGSAHGAGARRPVAKQRLLHLGVPPQVARVEELRVHLRGGQGAREGGSGAIGAHAGGERGGPSFL